MACAHDHTGLQHSRWPVSLYVFMPGDLPHIIPPPQGPWYLIFPLTIHTSELGPIWGLGRALALYFPRQSLI